MTSSSVIYSFNDSVSLSLVELILDFFDEPVNSLSGLLSVLVVAEFFNWLEVGFSTVCFLLSLRFEEEAWETGLSVWMFSGIKGPLLIDCDTGRLLIRSSFVSALFWDFFEAGLWPKRSYLSSFLTLIVLERGREW